MVLGGRLQSCVSAEERVYKFADEVEGRQGGVRRLSVGSMDGVGLVWARGDTRPPMFLDGA